MVDIRRGGRGVRVVGRGGWHCLPAGYCAEYRLAGAVDPSVERALGHLDRLARLVGRFCPALRMRGRPAGNAAVCRAVQNAGARVCRTVYRACVLGIVPAVLVACGVAKVKLPSLVCTGLAVVLLAALLLFQWQTIKAELQRRFHL